MASLRLFVISFFFSLYGCKDTQDSQKQAIRLVSEGDELPDIDKITFGTFCGESGGWGSMYELSRKGGLLTLTENTFHRYNRIENVQFTRPIIDKEKRDLSIQLLKSLPETFLQSPNSSQGYNCPDCPHNCSLFFTLTKDTTTKKYTFSYNATQRDKEVEKFRAVLSKTIGQLVEL